MNAVRFRFSAFDHVYTDLETGQQLPSITQLLKDAGLVDDTWMTEASRQRGTAVHELTKQYDLGALDVACCVSPYRGYLLSYSAAISMIRPEFTAIEEPRVHAGLRFAGTPDRVGTIFQQRGVLEIKSGEPTKSHPVQLALQCILVADELGLSPEHLGRFCVYVKPDGKFRLEEFSRRRDFDVAFTILRTCGS